MEKPTEQTAVKKSWKDNLGTLISITTLILAVCATLTAFKAAGFGNKMVLSQSQASDQWAYYQAKSIKETSYQTQRDAMELAMLQSTNPEPYKKKVAQYEAEVTRYKQEKAKIEADALALEHQRNQAQEYNNRFGQALIFLQIGILLSSLAAINKTALYWYFGLAAGGAGVAIFIHTMTAIM